MVSDQVISKAVATQRDAGVYRCEGGNKDKTVDVQVFSGK
jgi:hypothetical protein